jgi:hypothetical protein
MPGWLYTAAGTKQEVLLHSWLAFAQCQLSCSSVHASLCLYWCFELHRSAILASSHQTTLCDALLASLLLTALSSMSLTYMENSLN